MPTLQFIENGFEHNFIAPVLTDADPELHRNSGQERCLIKFMQTAKLEPRNPLIHQNLKMNPFSASNKINV